MSSARHQILSSLGEETPPSATDIHTVYSTICSHCCFVTMVKAMFVIIIFVSYAILCEAFRPTAIAATKHTRHGNGNFVHSLPQPQQATRAEESRGDSVSRLLLEPASSVEDRKSNKNGSSLKFKASFEYLTPSVPLPPASKNLEDFFKSDAYLQLPAGIHNRLSITKVATAYQLGRWNEEAERMPKVIVPPSQGDRVLEMEVTTPFLVFTIHFAGTLGVKLLLPSSSNNKKQTVNPEYQFTLVDQKFYADGPPPLVWMFNQLTGINPNQDKKGTYGQFHHGLYRVKSVISDDGTRMAFAMRMESELDIKFPLSLLQILPVDKTVIEKQGSQSLQQSMRRDIPPGVDRFRQLYLDWLEQ